MLAFVGFAVSVAFWPGLPGAASTLRWGVLLVLLPWLVRAVPLTIGHGCVIALLAWAWLTIAWAPVAGFALLGFVKLALLAAAFWLGSVSDDLRPLFKGLALGLGISSACAIAQTFGWQGLPQKSPPAGLFMNSALLAEISALCLLGLAAFRLWRYLPLVLPGALLPVSRGALLSVLVGLLVLMPKGWGRVAALMGLATVCALILGTGWRFESVAERIAIWRDTTDGLSVFGHGIGSYFTAFPEFASRIDTYDRRVDHAHNDGLEAVFELGVGVLPLVGLAVCCAFASRGHVVAAILAGGAVQSLVGFPLHMPATGFVLAVCAGHVCARGALVRDVMASGRTRLFRRFQDA